MAQTAMSGISSDKHRVIALSVTAGAAVTAGAWCYWNRYCDRSRKKDAMSNSLAPLAAPAGGISAATWNISAVNNNPFEYWISHQDKGYAELMAGVEKFVEAPGSQDVPIKEVFNDACFSELKALMQAESWEGVDVVEKLWNEDYSKRTIISGFLKDKAIGSKRLASMPDRLTNTINVTDSSVPACRPTVINNFIGSLSTIDEWWAAWKKFMFKDALSVDIKGKVKSMRPCEMLGKISKAKYPAITDEEERVSVPLQTLCQAIFDAIMVHIMVTLSPNGDWQGIKRSIVNAIYKEKDTNTCKILSTVCAGCDIICLQECASAFRDRLGKEYGSEYTVVVPDGMDPKRDQNSMVLLRKSCFPGGASLELTSKVTSLLEGDCPVQNGDLLAVLATHREGFPVLIASFHGDTNGLATMPVLEAVVKVLKQQQPDCKLVFGMDANVYLEKQKGMQNAAEFLDGCRSLGLRSCWRESANLSECCTTCHARTYLQPQLNKAVRSAEKLSKGDVNPKDHILVQSDVFDVDSCFKDNTGARSFIEKECFPSLSFPSDHAVVAAVFAKKTK